MAWDAEAKKVAIKAIGTVESNMKYDAINYRDPITVGIVQWYATRAANLLNKMTAAPEWANVSQRLKDSLSTYSESNGAYWTERDLRKDEGESLRPLLRSTTGVQVQNAQIILDFEDYRKAGNKLGLDAETNTPTFIYWCVMYHQSPRYARDILKVAGEKPTIARLHSLVLNHHWYKAFKTRFNQARAIIEANDSSGIPDVGVDEAPDDPEDGETANDINIGTEGERATGDLRSIELIGSVLHVHYKNGATVIAQPTNTGKLWVPGVDTLPGTGPAIVAPTAPEADPDAAPDPTTPPDPNVPANVAAKRNAVVKWMADRENKFNYSQSGNRMNPDASGYGDCSSTVRRAYKDVMGIEVGTYTVDQQNYGKQIFRGGKNQKPSLSLLEKGDLIFFCYRQSFTRVQHVEMWMGTRHMGHGGPKWHNKGPNYKRDNWWNQAPWIIVRRHIF